MYSLRLSEKCLLSTICLIICLSIYLFVCLSIGLSILLSTQHTHTHTHTYAYTGHTHPHKHTSTHTHKHIKIHTHTHTHTHSTDTNTHIHTHTHTHVHIHRAHTHTHTHTYRHTHDTLTQTHTSIHTRSHTKINTHTHTHTHTRYEDTILVFPGSQSHGCYYSQPELDVRTAQLQADGDPLNSCMELCISSSNKTMFSIFNNECACHNTSLEYIALPNAYCDKPCYGQPPFDLLPTCGTFDTSKVHRSVYLSGE